MGIVQRGGGGEGVMKLRHDGNGDAVSPPSVPFFFLFSLCFPPEKKGGGRPTGPPTPTKSEELLKLLINYLRSIYALGPFAAA